MIKNKCFVDDLGQVNKLTLTSSTHQRRKMRQTTNPSNECDSPEKGEERNRTINEDYYFFTCEIHTYYVKRVLLSKHLYYLHSFTTSVNQSAFLAPNK